MKRRSFLRLIGSAAAIAMAPAALNIPKLTLVNPLKRYTHRMRFATGGHTIHEVGIGHLEWGEGEPGYVRITLDKPITVLADEILDIEYYAPVVRSGNVQGEAFNITILPGKE